MCRGVLKFESYPSEPHSYFRCQESVDWSTPSTTGKIASKPYGKLARVYCCWFFIAFKLAPTCTPKVLEECPTSTTTSNISPAIPYHLTLLRVEGEPSIDTKHISLDDKNSWSQDLFYLWVVRSQHYSVFDQTHPRKELPNVLNFL